MSPKNYFLITAFGKDHPGMVAGVSQAVYALGGNMEDATMTRLGGEFTMMLVTALPSNVTGAKLDKAFKAIEKKLGLQLTYKAVPAGAAHHPQQTAPRYLISVYGTDQPGIVAKVTQAIAKHKVSITDLQTKIVGSSSKPVYVMLLELQEPPSAAMDALRDELDQLHHDLNVEISLQDIEAVAL